ncbi:MAG: serine hydroxymethyltransferase [Thermodesulfovibrionales bacterium]|nr:serine hydroxymethyltransferase [Thermodesulfovibrionales bacterium]
MNLQYLKQIDPEIYEAVLKEIQREEEKIILIASENYASRAILEAQGSAFTNKYAEGYPERRYYGGCKYADEVETLAIERARKLFGADHVNVQPHSGTQANMAVFFSVLNPNDTILGMHLTHGGHLSHGSPVNFTGMLYKTFFYGVNKETGFIDMNEVREMAERCKPKIIVVGASAYSRIIDFEAFSKIAKENNALLLADIAHIAGLIAAGLHPSPIPHADFVTSTTHKTMRGPRGGMIMCKEKYAKIIDKMVFPGIQGGPLIHVIAAKAVAFKEAMTEEFKQYQQQVVRNAKRLAEKLKEFGFKIITNGTDNHLMLVDLRNMNITGKDAETALEIAGITVNKNAIPYDDKPASITSGLRLGTPSVTTRGMKEEEMDEIADMIYSAIKNFNKISVLKDISVKAKNLAKRFPVYSSL